jgi:hypothetical protein
MALGLKPTGGPPGYMELPTAGCAGFPGSCRIKIPSITVRDYIEKWMKFHKSHAPPRTSIFALAAKKLITLDGGSEKL